MSGIPPAVAICLGCGRWRAIPAPASGLCRVCHGRPPPAATPCRLCKGAEGAAPRGLCWPCYRQSAAREEPAKERRPACRHCRDRPAQHGRRGMCYRCHRAPGVRDLYAPARPTAEQFDAILDARATRLPVQPRGDLDPEPAPVDPPAPPDVGDWRDAWWFAADPAAGLDLHPDTLPAAVAAAQRGAVADARAALGPGATVAAVSEYAALPPDIVTRHWDGVAS